MEISLIEYINKRKAELDAFTEKWLAEHKQDPEGWPLHMNRVDWDEQEQMITLEQE